MKNNSFGIYLLNLRNIHNENMNDMAERLSISKSYLYYLSSGERTVSNKIVEKLISVYRLSGVEIEDLNKSIANSRDIIKIDLSGIDYETRRIIIELVYRIPNMSDEEMEHIKNIILKEGE